MTSPPHACPDENTLAALGEGALDEAGRRAVEAHLDACQRCADIVTALAKLTPAAPLPARYRPVRAIGAGAMGAVWEAEDLQLGRRVAVKLITAASADDPERRARFMREARALAQLHHPNVIAVHDVGEHGGQLYLTLELVRGTTARRWRAAAPRTHDEVLAIWLQIAAGLAAVHGAGLVHRDVKPDNVLVGQDGRARLADLGLATPPDEASPNLTSTGVLVGTPLYMAPEQLAGHDATPRSDQFALCTSIWEALAGAPPFTGATVAALAVAMTRPPRPPPGDRRARQRFAALLRGLEPEPSRRWPSVAALSAALEAAPGTRSRRTWTGLSLAAAAGGALALALARPTAAPRTVDATTGPRSAPSAAPTSAAASARVVPPTPVPPDAAHAGTLACHLEYERFEPTFATLPLVSVRHPLALVAARGAIASDDTYQVVAQLQAPGSTNLSFLITVNELATGKDLAYLVLPPPTIGGAYLFESGTRIPPVTTSGLTYDHLRLFCALTP